MAKTDLKSKPERDQRNCPAMAPIQLDGTAVGAGNGVRTRDPNLGKVVLYH